MDIRVYNTFSRRTEVFVPGDPERVTMYVCGPTVYNFAHIGNARPAVLFGQLASLLRRRYPNVVYAKNITDVDDKINAAALEQQLPISTITERFTKAYHEDMQALGVDLPDVEPRATAHIAEIIEMVNRLIGAGNAYEAEGHVLFDVPSYTDYGSLSGRSRDEMIAGARVEVAPFKRHPADFVLWKPSDASQPGWESPWGRGRPGWHIECSAMAEAHLGDSIDIHAGGTDLVFPHHENEIAQSTCAHGGEVFARYWMHNGFVTVEGRKMSKSLGNVRLINHLRESAPGEALRYVLLNAHYRQPLDWSDSAVVQAQRTLDRLYGLLRDHADIDIELEHDEPLPEAFEEALCDDLNTPRALAELAALARELSQASNNEEKRRAKRALLSAGRFIGLLNEHPQFWFQHSQPGIEVDSAWIEEKMQQRQQARADRDFARADEIRDRLKEAGIAIEDSADGPRWKKIA